MAKLFFFLFSILTIAISLITLLVNAQNQSDFISIDCGASENYTDETTGINYNTDVDYIDSGKSKNISQETFVNNTNIISPQYQNLRSFPKGERNCYKLRPSKGKNHSYLIRAGFLYGYYSDEKDILPEFDLYLGVNKWKKVKIEDANKPTEMEIIHFLRSDYIDVCLVKTGNSTPFISVLELRPLVDQTYVVAQSESLELFARLDCGLNPEPFVRYQQDVLDRKWTAINSNDWDPINASEPTKTIDGNAYEPPQLVMSTAVSPKNIDNPLGFSWRASSDDGETPEFYMYLHFAELKQLQQNETREFNIYLNNDLWYRHLNPDYMSVSTVYSVSGLKGSSMGVMFNRTENSTLPPLLNAFEIYYVKRFLASETQQNDVDAIMNVKLTYNITRNWQGDPCEPSAFIWEGLGCNVSGSNPPRITTLNLSSSGLTGNIDPHIGNLTLIERLDLSNNSLSGTVPEFLSRMSSLNFLNLEGNNFSGTIPATLLEKSRNGSITLRVDENLNQDEKESNMGSKSDTHIALIVVASIGGFLLLVLTSGTILWFIRKRKQFDFSTREAVSAANHQDKELELKKQQFSYSEILSITNNFGRILGKGGFGTVYHGYLRDTQVAVKMLSPSSVQGYKQFHSEAKILTSVQHKNLTALIGYCNEGPNLGLLYEYMSNGDLAWHLSDKNRNPLNWEERLNVATDVAQGLEYLHCGCKPPIIHRDVKTTNILLNERLQAKLSDFGLSRAFALERDTDHESTIVVGTPGYLDPQYYFSNVLTEKSDVFSFGVVLLEIITGRPANLKHDEKDHVIEWVRYRLSERDIKSIVDPKLEQDFNEHSISKAVEIAMACVSLTSTQRPTMTQVTMELKQCLAMEVAGNKNSAIMSINSDPSLLGR